MDRGNYLTSKDYSYKVIKEDNEYIAACPSFPSLSFIDSDKDYALQGIRNLVDVVLEDLRENKEHIPSPT